MSTGIPSPITNGPAPTMFADDLFTMQQYRSRSTGALTDTSSVTFVSAESGAAVMNGVYVAYVSGSTDKFCEFSITGGNTVTIIRDAGTDFSTTNGTDNRVNIDINSTALRVENQLGTTETIELTKLM